MGQTFGQVEVPEKIINKKEFAYIRNKIVPIYEANVNIMTQAFLFGTAIHEGLRGYFNSEEQQIYVFRMKEHYERMYKNGSILKMKGYKSPADLCEITKEVIKKNKFKSDCYIRAIMYKSGLQYSLMLADVNDFALFAVEQSGFNKSGNGVNMGVSSWRRIQDNSIPARAKVNGAYVNSCLAITEAVDNGFDDAIFLTDNGNVAEGSGMNIFLVKDKKVITSPNTDDILEGITRDTVITIVKDELGLDLEVRSIDRTELYMADEIFLCGTAAEVLNVASVDHREIGNNEHPITQSITKHYFDIVRGKNKKYLHWLEPIF